MIDEACPKTWLLSCRRSRGRRPRHDRTYTPRDESMLTHDLPTGIPEWLAEVGGGEVTRLQRAVARREAWIVDVQRPHGDVTEGFLRLERTPKPGNPWSLARETRIV